MRSNSYGNGLGNAVNNPNDPRTREALLKMVENRTDIDGRFIDIRRLGPRGGEGYFSLLFSATDKTNNERIALKVYNPMLVTDPYRLASFEREEKLLRTMVGQADIIQWVAPRSTFYEMAEVWQGLGQPPLQIPQVVQYYAVELAHSSVEDIVAAGQWNAERLLLAFRAMCRAICRIHKHNIAHRDLKPGNFLVMCDGSVKLSDFGTAREFDSSTSALALQYGAPVGDRGYSAPELYAGLHDENPRLAFIADVFALGATLFEMFTGTPLETQLYDHHFQTTLMLMVNVPLGQRIDYYNRLLPSIVTARPLPSVAGFGAPVPPSIRIHIDDLYQAMASLDYRSRLRDFNRIYRRIEICLTILRNERAYKRWRALKAQRRKDAITIGRGGGR